MMTIYKKDSRGRFEKGNKGRLDVLHSEETKKLISKIEKEKYLKGEKTPWNKNKKGLQVAWNKGLKGVHLSPKSEFKIGVKGENAGHWKGGGKNYYKKQAKIRDDYTCQICGFRDPEIMEVDHIKPKSVYPNLVSELSNLVTLCPNCHRRKTNRDLKQINELY